MIKNKLLFILLLMVILIVFFIFFQYYKYAYLESVLLQLKLSNNIETDTTELLIRLNSIAANDDQKDKNRTTFTDLLSNIKMYEKDFAVLDSQNEVVDIAFTFTQLNLIIMFAEHIVAENFDKTLIHGSLPQARIHLLNVVKNQGGFYRYVYSQLLFRQRTYLITEIIFGIVFLVLFCFIYKQLNQKIVKPISHINGELMLIGKGNLNHRISYSENNEIGLLVDNLNQMISNLQKVISSKNELNAEIQKRIELEKSLQRSNSDLEHFAYVASHDLKEPLRMVTSFIKLFTQKYSSAVDEKGKEYIDFILDGANRMRNMIDDLLTVSRLNTQETTCQKVDLNLILKKVITNLSIKIHETGVAVHIENLPEAYGDHQRLESLFQNLIDNAIKFRRTEESSYVKVYSGKEDSELYSEYIVEDNGIGIDEKDFERIFQLFQRLHSRDEYLGTGIGLYIVQKIVSLHKGTVEIESKLGEGSKFIIKLPKIAFETTKQEDVWKI